MIKPYYQDDLATLYHGDCFEILATISDVVGVLTDPPYCTGANSAGTPASKYSWNVQGASQRVKTTFDGDNRDQRSFFFWVEMWARLCLKASAPGATFISFIDWRNLPMMTDAVQVSGWLWLGIAPWFKPQSQLWYGSFGRNCEYLVYASKGKKKPGPLTQKGVFVGSAPAAQKRDHVTQKPVDVLQWALGVIPEDGPVLDPFAGAGSTLVAARDLGRKSIGIELSEQFCEAAAKRLQEPPIEQDADFTPDTNPST